MQGTNQFLGQMRILSQSSTNILEYPAFVSVSELEESGVYGHRC